MALSTLSTFLDRVADNYYYHPIKPILSDEIYLAFLRDHFSHLPDKEIEFFVNSRRFCNFQKLAGNILRNEVQSILNVASGPFALENYVANSRFAQIDSFDIDENVEGLYKDLKATGLFDHVNYQTSSAEDFTTSKKYDLVLINDLFYTKYVDFFEIYDRFADMVAPEGYIYFDLLDIKAGKIWSALGKDERFVRYDLNQIREKVEQSGFEIQTIKPSTGVGGKRDKVARVALSRLFGIANNHIFLAKRKS